jgi:3-methylfumaryl-CoA hydratase
LAVDGKLEQMTGASRIDLQRWVGRSRKSEDVVTATPLRGLAAVLDCAPPPLVTGAPIPPAWHWLYFLLMAPHASLGADGADASTDFLPPLLGPARRMWAGGRFEFHQPLHLGERIERISTITAIEEKSGKQGPLVFLTLRHQISGEANRAVTEEQTLVFRSPPLPGQPLADNPAPVYKDWSREIMPDPVTLFRFSALTFNGHRIHYDRPYATEKEGYPGLLVHGPLQVLLLLELLRGVLPRPMRHFEYRALRPIFDRKPFTLNARQDGESVRVWSADNAGNIGTAGEAKA